MKRFLIVLLLGSALMAQSALAQEGQEQPEEKGFDKSKLFFGGNFGLGLGNRSTSIIVSPQVGYRFNEHFASGAGVNLNYYSFKDFSDIRTSYGYTGLNVFGRIYPVPYLLVQAQPELNYSWGSVKYPDNHPVEKLKGQFVPSLLLGGGAAISTGGNGALLLMIQYDVLQESRSPYGNKAFFSMGYNF